MASRNRTALITGANLGLGFEALAQLAEAGFCTAIITARTEAKAERAREQLAARVGRDAFDSVVLDNHDLPGIDDFLADLAEREQKIDLLLLNAGTAPPKKLVRTADGIEATVASTLVGHHQLTIGLLETGLLNDHARIVISGSESARGGVPTFNPVDVEAFSSKYFNGDLEAAIEAQFRMSPPAKYKPANGYASAKLFVTWWAAELAGRLSAGTTVNAVSPGNTPDTNASRNAPFYMRRLMIPMFKLMPRMTHSVARRGSEVPRGRRVWR